MNPQGIITQVPRDGTIQTQVNNNQVHNATTEVEAPDTDTPKRSFLRSLCCCFFRNQQGDDFKDEE